MNPTYFVNSFVSRFYPENTFLRATAVVGVNLQL
jgi:hypothetical protein